MDIKKLVLVLLLLPTVFLSFLGCQPSENHSVSPKLQENSQKPVRIVELTTITGFGNTKLRGYGLVVGLKGTGSSECPTSIRNYLKKIIKAKLSARSKINPDKLIDSRDTAVVTVLALMPPAYDVDERFDLVVSPIARSQTTSLLGGELLETPLKRSESFELTLPVASAKGEVFISPENARNTGFILNGGIPLKSEGLALTLKKPDFVMSSVIRDRINEKFGPSVAVARSASLITIKVPAKYKARKVKFIKMLNSLYVNQRPADTNKLIEKLTGDLAVLKNATSAEFSLEVIGRPAANKIIRLLDNPNAETRFRAAKCLLNITDQRGLKPLIKIAEDNSSEFQFEAIDAIAWAAPKLEAVVFLTRLLQQPDNDIQMAAYKHLKRLNDISVSSKTIITDTGKFDLDRIVQLENKMVWASRSGQAAITIFGSPIYIDKPLFIENPDRSIIATAQAEDNFITVLSTNSQTGQTVQITAPNELGRFIQTICQRTVVKNGKKIQNGLGLSYSKAVEIIKLLVEKNAVKADFQLGDEPEILKYINIQE